MERRRFPRILVKLPADSRSQRVWQVKDVINLSKGGVFLVTDKIEPPGTKLELIFDFGKEDKRKIQAEAVIVWVRDKNEHCGDKVLPPGMGIEFIKLFPQDAGKYLEELIKDWDKDDREAQDTDN